MFSGIAEFVSAQQGDSAEFIEKARAIAIGVAQDFSPTRYLEFIHTCRWRARRRALIKESI